MKLIPLTLNKFALVDDDDFEFLSQFKWMARKDKKTYYAQRSILVGGKQIVIAMHRVLLELSQDDPRHGEHRDRDGLNNQKHNLRIATNVENARNRGKRIGGTSRFKGVCLDKRWPSRPWCAQIYVQGKTLSLGHFAEESDAARAYDVAARKHFGWFAVINFPEEVFCY